MIQATFLSGLEEEMRQQRIAYRRLIHEICLHPSASYGALCLQGFLISRSTSGRLD